MPTFRLEHLSLLRNSRPLKVSGSAGHKPTNGHGVPVLPGCFLNLKSAVMKGETSVMNDTKYTICTVTNMMFPLETRSASLPSRAQAAHILGHMY